MSEFVSLKDHFLVSLPDANIAPMLDEAVVYLCAHTPEGAYGLIINKPLSVSFAETLQELGLNPLGEFNQPVFMGGPVQRQSGLVLHTAVSPAYRSFSPISDDICITSSLDILEDMAIHCGPKKILFALGYVKWEKNELETQFLENSWLHVPACQKILFDTRPEERWTAAIQQLGIAPFGFLHEAAHA
ncbi:MAG: YqgE/AlgH family protein [Pseudomonadota bacterium]